jgi:4,5-dihydroxyphthalate decarboxylase
MGMTQGTLVLKTVVGHHGYTEALRDGRVRIPGVTFEFVEIDPVHSAFKPMVETLKFDVSEMAITTYVVAKSFEKKITALPVVLSRNFHHAAIVCNVNSGIREPKDLEGKKVGIRAYAQTTPVWVRGILASEYGVDLNRVNWITFEGSHVKEYQDPDICTRAPEGKKQDAMVKSGETDASIIGSRLQAPEVRPLIPNADQVAAEWFKKTGAYPINHLVVVKSDLASAYPWLMPELFRAFKAAKEIYLESLYKEGPKTPADEQRLKLGTIVGGDPLPYGVEPNRTTVEMLLKFAHEQKLLSRPYTVEEMFQPSVLTLE